MHVALDQWLKACPTRGGVTKVGEPTLAIEYDTNKNRSVNMIEACICYTSTTWQPADWLPATLGVESCTRGQPL